MGIREIEFRAWCNFSKRMYPVVHEILFNREPPRIVVCSLGDVGTWESPDETVLFDYELMQYTGKKDKDGEKIFSGDIVDCEGLKSEIIFEEGAFWLKCGEALIDYLSENIKILGTAFENPELLEESK